MASNNSWQELLNNRFNRHFGGTKHGVADRYISGYFWVYWTDLPPKLQEYCGLSLTDISKVLTASCSAVTTIPAVTINKATATGLGGVNYSYPSNVDIGNEFATRHDEFSGLPIYRILHGWTKMIRDVRGGTSNLTGDDYTKSQYSSTIFYWTTKPDGLTIEYCACYAGCFPNRPNEDAFAHDVGTNDLVSLETSWNVDVPYEMEDWVIQKCTALANSIFADRNTIYQRREGV